MEFRWLGVFGLVFDTVGFALLAWDIWPEYRLYRLNQDSEGLHAQPREAETSSPRSSDVTRLAADTLKILAFAKIDSIRGKLRLPPLQGRNQSESVDPTSLAISREEVRKAVAAEQAALAKRFRPPIGIGISLVLAGFLLQLVAAWPR